MISITVGKTLNPLLWDGMILKPEIREKLLDIAKHFAEYLDIPNESIKDVTFTGSMANFHYGEKSDIDLHVIVDYKDIDDNIELVKKMLRAKKALYNDRHDITIKDREVELYPQDASEPHYSTAVYSVKDSEWITKPTPVYVDVDESLIHRKAQELIDQGKLVINTEDIDDKTERLDKFKEKIMNMRKAGLEKDGEFSTENLVFKELRNSGFLEKLLTAINKNIDKALSLDEMEKYQRQSIKINKINIPILLGLKGGGKAFRPKKNKKMKPYYKQPKMNYLSAPPGAAGGGSLEEESTSANVEVYGTRFPGRKRYKKKIAYAGYAGAIDPNTGNRGRFLVEDEVIISEKEDRQGATPAYCRKTPCKKMGFTQKASCKSQRIKDCYRGKKRGKK
jgi:predicted nucleotidyltransferase